MNRLIIFLVSIMLTNSVLSQNEISNITIDDLYRKNIFTPQWIDQLTSMRDGIHYAAIKDAKSIIRYSYATGKQVDVIADVAQFDDAKIQNINNFKFDNSETKILFYIDRQNIYRRSFTANYYVWDINAKKLIPISNERRQQVATFSPDGSKVVYVSGNNLYIKNLSDNTEQQITTDGKTNYIINGIPDWVYEEEFGYNCAFAWSPDSKNIAWCRFDESLVPTFTFSVFAGLEPQKIENKLYPSNYSYKYPKAGEANSVVTVLNFNLETNQKTQINLGTETDQYIPRIMWSPLGKLVIFRLNRLQNHIELLYADANSGTTSIFYSETNERYIAENVLNTLVFNKKGTKFFFMSERNGWNHIYLYKADGTLVNQITTGSYDVTKFIGFDEKTNTIFYQSAETSPINRDVFSIKTDGTKKTKISKRKGTNIAWFSAGYQYFINCFSDADTPQIFTLCARNGKQIRTLEDNAKLVETLKNKTFCHKQFLQFTTPDGIDLNAWILKPANFDSTKRYPVLMVQYSGPNSQQVLNEFDIDWEQVLVANGYIVFCCDGRGTGARGEEFRKCTYLQLGKYELADQINAANYLKTLPFVDADRIGIWGWSFGGFMVLNCLTQSNGTFKVGIAVAPVTNWRYYDNIYTERFMRTPQVNADGYDLNSPITHATDLQGNLLLIHGSADDNVHWQNSAEMCEALVQANKQFDYFVYTNRNHSIYGGNTRWHLYNKMLRFVLEKL